MVACGGYASGRTGLRRWRVAGKKRTAREGFSYQDGIEWIRWASVGEMLASPRADYHRRPEAAGSGRRGSSFIPLSTSPTGRTPACREAARGMEARSFLLAPGDSVPGQTGSPSMESLRYLGSGIARCRGPRSICSHLICSHLIDAKNLCSPLRRGESIASRRLPIQPSEGTAYNENIEQYRNQ